MHVATKQMAVCVLTSRILFEGQVGWLAIYDGDDDGDECVCVGGGGG